MTDIIVGVVGAVMVVIFLAMFGIILAFPIMWCWNYTMPAIFHLPTITWGQAWCIDFLAGCLIKSTQTNNNK
jgi:hypothetical protein